MFRNSFLGIFVLMPLFAIANTPIANPPESFEWVSFEEIYAYFLKPKTWRYSLAKGKLMGSLIMTPTQSDHLNYQPVFTVNTISNLIKTNYQLISEQVNEYAERLSSQNDIIVSSRTKLEHGSYVGEAILLKYNDEKHGELTDQRLYYANDTRDWLVVISFRSASADWASLEKLRKPMLSKFLLH